MTDGGVSARTGATDAGQRQVLVLVLGMHRSGTSTVAGALGLLGAAMPKAGLALAQDNPKGHFEPAEIVALHDRVLASGGAHWWDWDPFSDSWYDTAESGKFGTDLAEIVRAEFGDAPLFVIKDPRTCKLVPLWRRVMSTLDLEPVVVLPYRHPIDVARSLRKRDGFPLANSQLTWLRHVLEAERQTRDIKRAFIRYETLLQDWRPTLERVVDELGLRLPRRSARAYRELENFIDPALRHNAQDPDSLAERPDLHDWMIGALRAYDRLAVDPRDGEAMKALDALRLEFDRACEAFTPALDATNLAYEDAHARAGRLPELEARADRAESAVLHVPALEAELASLRERTRSAEQAAARTATLEAEIAVLRHKAEDAARIPALEAEIVGLRQNGNTAHGGTDHIRTLESELANTRLRADTAERVRVPALEAEVAILRHNARSNEMVAKAIETSTGRLGETLVALTVATGQSARSLEAMRLQLKRGGLLRRLSRLFVRRR